MIKRCYKMKMWEQGWCFERTCIIRSRYLVQKGLEPREHMKLSGSFMRTQASKRRSVRRGYSRFLTSCTEGAMPLESSQALLGQIRVGKVQRKPTQHEAMKGIKGYPLCYDSLCPRFGLVFCKINEILSTFSQGFNLQSHFQKMCFL